MTKEWPDSEHGERSSTDCLYDNCDKKTTLRITSTCAACNKDLTGMSLWSIGEGDNTIMVCEDCYDLKHHFDSVMV